MLTFLILAVLVFAAIMLLYYAVRRFYPSFGTVVVNAVMALLATGVPLATEFLSGLQDLPWSSILSPANAAAIMFAMAAANYVIRFIGHKKPVGSV